VSDERWCVPGNLLGARRECTERRSTFGKTAKSSPSALRYPSELRLLTDPRKLIQCSAAGLAIFRIELDQIGKRDVTALPTVRAGSFPDSISFTTYGPDTFK
jgi:hypothetical protein